MLNLVSIQVTKFGPSSLVHMSHDSHYYLSTASVLLHVEKGHTQKMKILDSISRPAAL